MGSDGEVQAKIKALRNGQWGEKWAMGDGGPLGVEEPAVPPGSPRREATPPCSAGVGSCHVQAEKNRKEGWGQLAGTPCRAGASRCALTLRRLAGCQPRSPKGSVPTPRCAGMSPSWGLSPISIPWVMCCSASQGDAKGFLNAWKALLRVDGFWGALTVSSSAGRRRQRLAWAQNAAND